MHEEKKIVKEGVRTFKFSDGNKLNSLYEVTLLCVIADIKVSIITDGVDWYSTSWAKTPWKELGLVSTYVFK